MIGGGYGSFAEFALSPVLSALPTHHRESKTPNQGRQDLPQSALVELRSADVSAVRLMGSCQQTKILPHQIDLGH